MTKKIRKERTGVGGFFAKMDATDLRLRILSSAVLIPAVLFLIYLGGIGYQLAVIVAMVLGLREWVRLVANGLQVKTKTASLIVLVFVLGIGAWVSLSLSLCLGIVLTVFLNLLAKREGADSGFSLCMPYLGGSGLALLALRADPVWGMESVFYLVAVVWATDIGGYLAGRLIGGPKLLPRISPKKTWAGLLGGMGLAALAAACVVKGFGAGGWQLVVLALVLAVVAQAGDLFESYVKRRSGMKDSGGLIPGHGGILDRIDGLLFASVFLALLHVGKGMLAL